MIDDALLEVKNLLRTNMGEACVEYYAGDIGIPAKSVLPCIIVRERSTKVERVSTAKDQYRFGISILVITNLVDSLKTAGLSSSTRLSRQKLRKLIEEADTDGAPKTTTVLGALMQQANIRGSHYVYSLNPEVNYQLESPDGYILVAAEVTIDLVTDLVTRKA
jgi:hypothetical protein